MNTSWRVVLTCALFVSWSQPLFAAYRLIHIAGQAESGYSGDNDVATAARLNQPASLALAADGTLYVADTGNQRIRKITTAGVISTVAGNGSAANTGDGGPAVAAALDTPSDVAVDAAGDLYVVTASSLRRVDAGDGRISTLFGVPSWRYAVSNDRLGDVFLVVSPFVDALSYGLPTQPYVVTIMPPPELPTFAPVSVQGIDWHSEIIYRAAAGDPQHLAVAFDGDQLDYGVALGGHTAVQSNLELYAVNRPAAIGVSPSGTLYLTGGSFYTGAHHYVLQQVGSGLIGIAGGGSSPAADGAPADTVTLEPTALAVASDQLLYIVQAPSQIYALRRGPERHGVIGGTVTGTRYPQLVTVLATADDVTLHYAQPDANGRFRFRDLTPGTYRVYAHYDEEGLSCDATNCGWSGLPGDCPNTNGLNDPMVQITTERPLGRVRLRLLESFPCI